jgi:hypothetical protein
MRRLEQQLQRENEQRGERRAPAQLINCGRRSGELPREGDAEQRRARRLECEHQTRCAQHEPGALDH